MTMPGKKTRHHDGEWDYERWEYASEDPGRGVRTRLLRRALEERRRLRVEASNGQPLRPSMADLVRQRQRDIDLREVDLRSVRSDVGLKPTIESAPS